jgi:hypothetical protein
VGDRVERQGNSKGPSDTTLAQGLAGFNIQWPMVGMVVPSHEANMAPGGMGGTLGSKARDPPFTWHTRTGAVCPASTTSFKLNKTSDTVQ